MLSADGAPHVQALDGLRGAAVLVVIAFHAGHLTGGYLGVDLFFVLSGYLITTLLVREQSRTGRIALGHFWSRRARRLLPAILLVLAVASLVVLASGPLERAQFRADALGTLFYVANWITIHFGTTYFVHFAEPSPLQHTWSLAIEEQFYLVWPLVAMFVLGRVRTTRPDGTNPAARRLLVLSLGGAALSAGLMIAGHLAGTNVDRLYLGTDTRIAAILLGAALACAVATYGPVREARQGLLQVGGWLALLVLLAAWWRLDGRSPLLYQGGLLVCSIAGAVVIAAATQAEDRPLARALSWAPLRGAGLISYGLYLWHWPIFAWVTEARVGFAGAALLAFQLALTLAVSLLSYYLVEMPIRRGALHGLTVRIVTPAAVALVVAMVILAGTPPSISRDAETAASAIVPLGPLPATVAPSGTSRRPPDTGTPPGTDPAAGRPVRVLLAGDSIGESVARTLLVNQGRYGVEVRSESEAGCGLVRSNPEIRRPDGTTLREDVCLPKMGRLADAVQAWHPDIVLVVIGWPGHTERLVDGAYRQPCDPAYDAWYAGEVRAALDIAAADGAAVYLTTAPYYRSARTPAGTDRFTDCLNRIYRDTAANARVTMIDLAGFICPAGECRREQDGIVLRPDGLHFEGASSVWTATWLLQQIWARPPAATP